MREYAKELAIHSEIQQGPRSLQQLAQVESFYSFWEIY